MTSIRQLIIDSLREAGILEAGEAPEVNEFEEALRVLERMFKSLFGNELGEPLKTINYGLNGITNAYGIVTDMSSVITSTYVPGNLRIVFNASSANTIFLSPKPQDGARFAVIDNKGNFSTAPLTINANGRQIEGSTSLVLNTNSINREWFYRDDLASWVKVIDLDPADPSPLPDEFDDLLITLLAFRLNPRYGATTSSEMGDVMKRARRVFRARYKQQSEQSSELALLRLSSYNGVWFYTGLNSTDEFNRGR